MRPINAVSLLNTYLVFANLMKEEKKPYQVWKDSIMAKSAELEKETDLVEQLRDKASNIWS